MNLIPDHYTLPGARLDAMVLTREGLEDWLHLQGSGEHAPSLTLRAREGKGAADLFDELRRLGQPIRWCPNALAGPLRFYFSPDDGDMVMSWPKQKDDQ